MKEKPDIPVGTKVQEGQPIGTMGNTGGSKGAHLHFEVMENQGDGWKYINPADKKWVIMNI